VKAIRHRYAVWMVVRKKKKDAAEDSAGIVNIRAIPRDRVTRTKSRTRYRRGSTCINVAQLDGQN